MKTAHLIYNPLAGRFPAGPFLDRAVKVLEGEGWAVQVEQCLPGKELADLASDAVAAKADAVFVAGGDGSVGPVAGALAGTQTAMGVLPTGTANVFATELGLQRMDWTHWFAAEAAAAKLARGQVQAGRSRRVQPQAVSSLGGRGTRWQGRRTASSLVSGGRRPSAS